MEYSKYFAEYKENRPSQTYNLVEAPPVVSKTNEPTYNKLNALTKYIQKLPTITQSTERPSETMAVVYKVKKDGNKKKTETVTVDVRTDLTPVIEASNKGTFKRTNGLIVELGNHKYKHLCTSGPATFYSAIGKKLNGRWWDTGNPKTATGTKITEEGFKEVWSGTAESAKNKEYTSILQPGDIMLTYGKTKSGDTSHACMWNGTQWVSDTYQGDKSWVIGSGRLGDRSAVIYRLPKQTMFARRGMKFQLGGLLNSNSFFAEYKPIPTKRTLSAFNVPYVEPPSLPIVAFNVPYVEPPSLPIVANNPTLTSNYDNVFSNSKRTSPRVLYQAKTNSRVAGDSISDGMLENLLHAEGSNDVGNGKCVAKVEKQFGENFATGPYGMVYKETPVRDKYGRITKLNSVPFKAGETIDKDKALENAKVHYEYKAWQWKKALLMGVCGLSSQQADDMSTEEWNEKLKEIGLTQNKLDALVSSGNGTYRTWPLVNGKFSNWSKKVVENWNNPEALTSYWRQWATTAAGNGKVQPGLALRRQFEADWFNGGNKNFRDYLKDYYNRKRS